MDICFACKKGKLIRNDFKLTVQCNYCMIEITEQAIVGADPQQLMDYANHQWQHRLGIAQSLSTAALLDILAERGVPVGQLQSMENSINPNMSSDLLKYASDDVAETFKQHILKELNKQAEKALAKNEPKPWSYREAAASEFDLDEGKGLA